MNGQKLKRWAWRNYRRSAGFKFWLERRFTPAGLLTLCLMLASVGVGIDTNLAMAFQAATLLACALLISFLWSFARRPALAAERLLPRFGTAGTPIRYRVRISNPTRLPQAGLAIMEDLGDPRPTRDQFLDNPEPGENKRNIFDRTFSFYRWSWLLEQNKLATCAEQPLPALPPGGSDELTLELIPRQRGLLRLEGLTIAWPDPFGLYRAFTRLPLPQTLLILPLRHYVPPLALPGSMQYQQGGVALASSVGESEEFVSLRDYRRGDPLRHIHWKSVCKTGRLIVKEFQDEFFVRHALVLDTFVPNSRPEVFEEAVSIAASFACTVRTQESLLDLLFVGAQAYCFTVGRGVGQTDQLLEILASVRPCTNRPFSTLESLVLRHVEQVSGCICVLLAWDEERRELVKKMRIMGIPLLVLVVTEAQAPTIEAREMGPEVFRHIPVGKAAEILAQL